MPLHVEGGDMSAAIKRGPGRPPALAQDSLESLRRDLRVAKQYARELSIKRLAARYKVSESTIKREKQNLDDGELAITERASK